MSERQAKYKTGAEKEIHESEKSYPDLSEQGREYIEIIKADKLQLWDENKKLKKALDKAVGILAGHFCHLFLPDGATTADICAEAACDKCWMNYLKGDANEKND